MKIAIYTLPLNFNYGGLLQAFALQTILRRMGHESVVLDRQLFPKVKIKWVSRLTLRNLFRKYIKREIPYISLPKYLHETYSISTQYTEPFINNYINRILIDDYSKLCSANFDIIICGSDQIWRRCFQPDEDSVYNSFLAFTKDWSIKRISYAASFGVDYWEYFPMETIVCKQLISKFEAVSVRESSGVELCSKKLGIQATLVLDPTLLLEANDYLFTLNILDYPKSSGDLIVYLLDQNEEKDSFVKRIATETGLKPYVVNSKAEDLEAPIEKRIQPPVEKWIRSFYDSKLVLTDSYHACVFSILFRKPFYVLANRNRGLARITSLLGALGLENRIIFETTAFITQEGIDYDTVYNKLKKLKDISIDFLKSNLR